MPASQINRLNAHGKGGIEKVKALLTFLEKASRSVLGTFHEKHDPVGEFSDLV